MKYADYITAVERLAAQRTRGIITEDEFAWHKDRLTQEAAESWEDPDNECAGCGATWIDKERSHAEGCPVVAWIDQAEATMAQEDAIEAQRLHDVHIHGEA